MHFVSANWGLGSTYGDDIDELSKAIAEANYSFSKTKTGLRLQNARRSFILEVILSVVRTLAQGVLLYRPVPVKTE